MMASDGACAPAYSAAAPRPWAAWRATATTARWMPALVRLPRPPLPAVPGAGHPPVGRTAPRRHPARALLPRRLYAAGRAQRPGPAASGGDPPAAVRLGVGDGQGLRARPEAPRRRAGHERGAAHLGPEPVAARAPALLRAGRGAVRGRHLAGESRQLPVPGARAVATLPRPQWSRHSEVRPTAGNCTA